MPNDSASAAFRSTGTDAGSIRQPLGASNFSWPLTAPVEALTRITEGMTRDKDIRRAVPHEISHQVLHQATKNAFNSPPQWLDEGLATYWQETGRDRFYSYALELAG